MENRVLHVVEASATGTLAMAALLANLQAQAGYSVTVIYSLRPESPANIASYFDGRIALINIPMSGFISKIISIAKLRNKILYHRPETVFLHSTFAGFLGRLANIPQIRYARFFYIPHCISFMRKDIGLFKKALFIFAESIVAFSKAEYIACSASEKRVIERFIRFRKCHLIENAVDDRSIPRCLLDSFDKREKVVITVGQIRPQKGPNIFCDIAQSVWRIDPGVSFVWVGDGDKAGREKMQAAGVKVLGWVPKDKVWEHLAGAQIYLSTAVWEGMPVSVIESSFAGLPVIASNCAGNIDVISHGETGWIFNSIHEARDYILLALGNEAISKKVANQAYSSAIHRFNQSRYLDDMEKVSRTSL